MRSPLAPSLLLLLLAGGAAWAQPTNQAPDNVLSETDSDFVAVRGVTSTPATPIFSLHTGTTRAPQSFLRSLCSALPGGRGRVAHPLFCEMYVDCWQGRALEKLCIDGQLYSDLPGGFCDYREYVDCGARLDPKDDQGVGQQPPPPAGGVNSTLILPTAPQGFTKLDMNGGFYLFFNVRTHYARARQVCQQQGAGVDLAVIETEAENRLIGEQIAKLGGVTTNPLDLTYAYYIGLSGALGVPFTWLGAPQPPTYTSWAPGAPDPRGGGHCAVLTRRQTDSLWLDVSCGFELRFICEYTPPKGAASGTRARTDPAKIHNLMRAALNNLPIASVQPLKRPSPPRRAKPKRIRMRVRTVSDPQVFTQR